MRPYKSTMLTPSPLRRKTLAPADSDTSLEGELGLETPVDADDVFSQSPYRPAAPLKSFDAHLRSVAGPSRFGKNSVPFDDDDDDVNDDALLFLSTPIASSTPAPKAAQQRNAQRARRSERPTVPAALMTPAPASRRRTPARQAQPRPRSTIETSSRRRSPAPPLPRPLSIAQPRMSTPTPPAGSVPLPSGAQRTPVSRAQVLRVNTTGVKRKSTELPVTAPYPKGMLTPLAVTKTSGEGSFDRLAPLPAPKFRSPTQPDEDAEGFLRGPETMKQLCINEKGKATVDETVGEEEAVDVSPGGHIVKRRAKSRPMSWELKQRASGAAQGPAKVYKLDAPSSVEFPSSNSAMSRTRTLSNSSTAALASPKPRQRLSQASNVSTSSSRSRTGSSTQSRARTQSTVQAASLRPPPRRVESSSSATLFFGPAIDRTSTPAKSGHRHSRVIDSPPSSLPRPPLFGRRQTSQRHSYAGPTFSPGWSSPTGPLSPVSMPFVTDDEAMGEITDEDDERMPSDMGMIADMDEGQAGMDEADLFFQSSSFNASVRSDEGLGADEDSFGWGSAPANISLFSINVTESTPSPRGKKPSGVAMLEKKFKPRDSGISLSDEDDAAGGLAPPRPSGRGFGRSGSVSMMPPPPPPLLVTSTSASTVASSDDMELVTPGFGPSSSSGWPSFLSNSASGSDADGPLALLSSAQSEQDAFILRTLLHAQSVDTSAAAMPKRPPGTPQKRARAAVGLRPWQSAIANKVGFDFGPEDSDGGAGEKKAKKKPRKSLPAAFPALGQGRRKSAAAVEDLDDDSDASPSTRPGKERYEGLGLGRPSAARGGRASWLMRRSSSGAISTTSGSQSGEGSWPATPTADRSTGWQLPPPRIPAHISPLKARLPSHLSPARTASSSSSSTAATASPTASRLFQVSNAPSQKPQVRAAASSNAAPAPVVSRDQGRITRGRISLPLPRGPENAEEAEGKFEREFVEVGEVGSGEFGKVMKVRRKGLGPEVWAVKKSKRFEGGRHRLRLREEVDILRLLATSYAHATGQPAARHPNVLAYVDSWEQDDALFIQTELCELGNFAHFLWEYGRAFPQLDEARVWKILADLSNGVRFIHAAGVLHLDLKPANIFVTGAGRFKIGDFGMASVWPRPGSSPAAAAAVATGERPPGFEREGDKCYLAPEVLQGRYGTAADMFSLGITMLETATNIVVPDQGEPWHRLRQDDFSQVDFGAASGALVGLIRGMMSAEPGRRVDAEGVWTHPVVARTRAAMDRAGVNGSSGGGGGVGAGAGGGGGAFAASPLAAVAPGFLEEVLGEAMDESA